MRRFKASFNGIQMCTTATEKLAFFGVDPIVRPADYTVTNHTSDKTFDCNVNDTLVTSDVLGTLIKDLIDLGILGGTVA